MPYRKLFVEAKVPPRPLPKVKEFVHKRLVPFKTESIFSHTSYKQNILASLLFTDEVIWNGGHTAGPHMLLRLGDTFCRISDYALEARRGYSQNGELIEFLREREEDLFERYFDQNLVALSKPLC